EAALVEIGDQRLAEYLQSVRPLVRRLQRVDVDRNAPEVMGAIADFRKQRVGRAVSPGRAEEDAAHRAVELGVERLEELEIALGDSVLAVPDLSFRPRRQIGRQRADKILLAGT